MAETIKADLQSKGMEVVSEIDLEAFKAAGDKAYEALGITEARDAVQAELAK